LTGDGDGARNYIHRAGQLATRIDDNIGKSRQLSGGATSGHGMTPPLPSPVEWRTEPGLLDYPAAVVAMEARVAAIRAGSAPDLAWLVEHPPLYTGGTSARPQDLLDAGRFPVYPTGRGGQYTYHGPGQRVVYLMLDLKPRGGDVRGHVRALEQWVIDALARFGVTGERRDGRVGIWVDRGGGREDKIAAIGVRVRQWVSYHGLALNVAPDLSDFAGIVPCGIAEANLGVTSLADLGVAAGFEEVDAALRATFAGAFGLAPADLAAAR
jgi:lipoyl(octanoyl) transferase